MTLLQSLIGLKPLVVVYFYQAGAPISIENAKFWPFLAILSRIYALVGAPITGLNSAVVPQN